MLSFCEKHKVGFGVAAHCPGCGPWFAKLSREELRGAMQALAWLVNGSLLTDKKRKDAVLRVVHQLVEEYNGRPSDDPQSAALVRRPDQEPR